MMTPDECRAFDRFAMAKLGIPGVVLMENAGRGCAEAIQAHILQLGLNARSAVVLCGPGNNGGDGFVIARHLWNFGWRVRVVLSGAPERYSGDAKVMLFPVLRLPIEVIQFPAGKAALKSSPIVAQVGREPTNCIVDALLGTGSQGQLRPPLDQMVAMANDAEALRYAIDLPSGLNSVDGESTSPTFSADVTCTFIDKKLGFGNPEAERFLGFVKVIDIGISRRIQTEFQ